jgi:hypothetical protein
MKFYGRVAEQSMRRPINKYLRIYYILYYKMPAKNKGHNMDLIYAGTKTRENIIWIKYKPVKKKSIAVFSMDEWEKHLEYIKRNQRVGR